MGSPPMDAPGEVLRNMRETPKETFDDSTVMLTLRLIEETQALLTLSALTSAGLNNKASFGSALRRILSNLQDINEASQKMRDDFVDGKKG